MARPRQGDSAHQLRERRGELPERQPRLPAGQVLPLRPRALVPVRVAAPRGRRHVHQRRKVADGHLLCADRRAPAVTGVRNSESSKRKGAAQKRRRERRRRRGAPLRRPAAAAASSGGSKWTISARARSRSLPTSGGTCRHAPKAAATPAGARAGQGVTTRPASRAGARDGRGRKATQAAAARRGRTEGLHRLEVAGGPQHEHPPPRRERLPQPRQEHLQRRVAVHRPNWGEPDEALDVVHNEHAVCPGGGGPGGQGREVRGGSAARGRARGLSPRALRAARARRPENLRVRAPAVGAAGVLESLIQGVHHGSLGLPRGRLGREHAAEGEAARLRDVRGDGRLARAGAPLQQGARGRQRPRGGGVGGGGERCPDLQELLQPIACEGLPGNGQRGKSRARGCG